ncbi:MAG: helix-turn-helix transcriptional regulator [Planctomycetes bacterium]|nr:helix-turn-helix transcriptional regulator [Planctomycetota bacterium]
MGEINMDLRDTHMIGARTRERIVSPKACPALAALGIQLTGLSDTHLGFKFVRVKPQMSQVLACLEGSGRVLLDGTWKHCGPGKAYVTPLGALHAYEAPSRGPWRICWVIFEPPTSGGSGDLAAPLVAGGKPLLLETDPKPLAAAIEGLYREHIGPGEPGVLHAWAQLVSRLARRIAGPLEIDPRLWKVWEAVGADLASPWTMDALSDVSGTSTEHLRRLCQRQLGRSPMRHVAFLRMERAAALLATGAYTIEEVAFQVGYENPFAFSTAFKRFMKAPPSQYRRGRGA